jgi:hypothetical protein
MNAALPDEEFLSLKPFSTTHIHLDKDNQGVTCRFPATPWDPMASSAPLDFRTSPGHPDQRTIMRQEKLASIGRLSAGVAHEINNRSPDPDGVMLPRGFSAGHPASRMELIAKRRSLPKHCDGPDLTQKSPVSGP